MLKKKKFYGEALFSSSRHINGTIIKRKF